MSTETSSNLAYISNENHATGSISERGFLAKNDGTTFAPQIDAADVKIADGKYLAAALENLVLAYAQKLSKEQREAVRANIKAVSYEDASLEASDAAIARANIGAMGKNGGEITGDLVINGKLSVTGSDDSGIVATRSYVDEKVFLTGSADMRMETYDPNNNKTDIFGYTNDKIATLDTTLKSYINDKINELTNTDENTPLNFAKRITALEKKVDDLETLISNFESPAEGSVCHKINTVITDLSNHLGDSKNPHGVTKAQVKLGYVENKKLIMEVSADGKTLSTSYKASEG